MSEEKNIKEQFTEDIPKLQENVDEIISQKQPIKVKEPQNQNMEVHKHPHHVTHKKKWGEYLLEFFMLFLAVFLGFIAENQREHMVEKSRARQYASSLMEDLKADTAELNTTISGTRNYALNADTILSELDKPASVQNDTLLQRLTAQLALFNFYDPQLGTYNQLKNYGSLRYFSIEISKRLNHYETYANYILKMSNQHLEFRTELLLPFINKITNTRFIRSLRNEIKYNGPIFIEKPDKKLTQEWYTLAYSLKKNYNLIVKKMELQLKNAKELIVLLEKKYHFDNE
ncbi:MAG: hypothetical protein H0W75_09690 [Chitinophagaceae bacterium]|nr:hypothetical protein [Chitinophagaceae bacterium]